MNELSIGSSLVNLFTGGRPAMPKQTSFVTLEDDARPPLEDLLQRGTHATRNGTRARLLLTAAAGVAARALAAALAVGRATVERPRRRFVEAGLGALQARPRPGTWPPWAAQAPARLIAAAWSAAPEGRQRWTVQRLADRVVALGLAAASASARVRRVFKTPA